MSHRFETNLIGGCVLEDEAHYSDLASDQNEANDAVRDETPRRRIPRYAETEHAQDADPDSNCDRYNEASFVSGEELEMFSDL